MAEYLLDTNHLSYLQQQHLTVLHHLAALLPGDRVLTSVVNVGELLRGVYLLPEGRRRRELLQRCNQVISRMDETLLVDIAAAEKYAEIGAMLHIKGRPIPVNDIWVAAVALARRAVLVTNDAHFSHVDSLQVENWTR